MKTTLSRKISSVLSIFFVFFVGSISINLIRVDALSRVTTQCQPECSPIYLHDKTLSIAKDSQGNFYMSDYYYQGTKEVVKVNSAGEEVLRFDGATNGNSEFGYYGVNDIIVGPGDIVFAMSGSDIPQVELFDTNGNFLRAIGTGDLNANSTIAIYNNELYIFGYTKAIRVYDISTGTYVRTIGTYGTGAGQIYRGDIAIDSVGNVYVANNSFNKIVKYNNSGILLDEWDDSDYIEDLFLYVSGITVDSSDNLYVGTSAFNPVHTGVPNDPRVTKINSDGNLLDQIVPFGYGDGQVETSAYLSILDDVLYVTDQRWEEYELFQLDGTSIGQLGSNAGPAEGELGNIADIEFDAAGNIYVAEDFPSSRVTKFDSNWNFVRTYGEYGYDPGDFYGVGGVDIDSTGTIFISNFGGNMVVMYAQDGTFLGEFGGDGSGNGQFNWIPGIFIDENDIVYVVDSYNNRIQWFDNSGNYLGQFGTYGSGQGEFSTPSDIAIDSSGDIYVLDADNYRVQKFDSSWNYLYELGSATWSDADGEFMTDYDLSAIYIDSSDNVYIADTWNYRFQVFDSTGTFLYKWGDHGNGMNHYDLTSAIAVKDDGTIYAADYLNGFIQVVEQHAFITMPTGLTVEDVNGNDLSTGGVGGYGAGITVSIKASGDILSEVIVDLTSDRDWSSISGQVDPVNGKAFVSNVAGAPGTASSHAFYIGIPSGKTSSKSVLCPNATSISESSVSCAGGVQFSDGETKTVGSDSVTVTKVATGGKSYWKANGLSNKMGGAAVVDVTPTPDPAPEEDTAEDTTEDTTETTTYINLGSGSAEGDYLTITEQTEEYGDGEVEVCWETNKESTGKVEYGIFGEDYEKEIQVDEPGMSHCVTIEAYDEENTEYQYKITAETEDGELTEIERQITIYPIEEEVEEVIIEVLDVDVETEGTYENGSDTKVEYETTYDALCRVDYGYQEDGLTRTYSSDVKGVTHTAYLVTADFPEGTDVYGMINCNVDVPGEDVPRQVTKALFIARDSLKDQVTYEEEESWIPGAVGIGLAAIAAVLGGAMIAVYPNSIVYAFGWLRNKKKRRPWGLVYDRGENKPVAFAVVELYKGEEFIQKVVTDLEGRYMLPVDPGSYRVVAKQSGYEEAVEEITVTEPKSANMDIGLIKDGNASMIYTLRKVLPKINKVVFMIGFLLALIITLFYFNWINLVVLVFYTIQIVTWFMLKSPRGTGFVYQSGTGKKVKGAIVKVHNAEDLGVEDSQMTNEEGRYGFLLKDGEYRLSVTGRGYEIDEEEARRNMKIERQGEEVYIVAQIVKGDFVDIAIPVKPSQKASGFAQ